MQVAVFADGWEFDSGRDASPQGRYDKSRPVVRISGPGRLGRASVVPEALPPSPPAEEPTARQ
jgi:hypothetical protein